MKRDNASRDTFPDTSTNSQKYTRKSILNKKKIIKGKTRWNQFSQTLTEISPYLLKGPILDFGSGVGYFVLEGLRRNYNIWGVDLLPGKISRYRKLIDYTESPEGWKERCVAANGEELPFRAGSFTAVSSWYVFEHIPEPGRCIREMVRVTRPGGVIAIRAQDARNGWEGHCKIPWIPFLPKRLSRIWIEEFGADPALRDGVIEITQPQVEAIFEELGCRILVKAAEPRQLIEGQQTLATEREVRNKARQVRQDFSNGTWQPQPENLYIYAQKIEK
jgi:ubiquinone/menaquinone biosynthesis C-methylase UbiE